MHCLVILSQSKLRNVDAEPSKKEPHINAALFSLNNELSR
ncbi:hypothetical protein N646_4066 [Vibrio alginolyticus NBRC 15630 = ATCC 17749]|uniref:Uncharacterized protein n=1 Tax=Vibrio alginolyticus (strain ATCC 17749 / DSM 2171 / NBRC 15630 / NCIMB 1903 / NCTC 12160 / XII-53) TaxID=1219076 RepID=A0A2I3CQU7_VIBAX|nr:hypothetical protein N646_4066 [Vibrio alginolyticus NBRC 15630 = ATCC 17749]